MSAIAQNRRRERLVLGDSGKLLTVDLHWGSASQQSVTGNVLDLNGQGIAILLPERPSIASLPDLRAISFFWKGKKIGSKSIERAFVEPAVSEGRPMTRLRAIYHPPHAGYYLPCDLILPAGRNIYRIDPDRVLTMDARFARSVIGCGSDYRDRRRGDRLRIALEDAIHAELRASTKTIWTGRVAELSSNGAGVFLDDATDLNRLRTKLDELLIYVNGELVQRKQLGRYSTIPVHARRRPMVKIRSTFATRIKATFNEKDPTFSRESQSVRLREKRLYPTIIRALVSEPGDVRFEVTNDDRVIEKIYRLRYETYLDEGKICQSEFSDGRMTDKFDAASIHVCAHVYGEIVAAARIIPQSRVERFEFEESVDLPSLRRPGVRYAEAGRFCVGRLFRNDVNKNLSLTLRLIGEAARVCWSLGINAVLITAYKPHVKLYQTIGFRPVSNYVKLRGFNYEYVVMEWDLDPGKTALLYRHYLTKIRAEVLSTGISYGADNEAPG